MGFPDGKAYSTRSVLDLLIEVIVFMDSGAVAFDHEKIDRMVCLHDDPFVEEGKRRDST